MRWMVLGLAGGCGRAAVTEVVLTPDAPDGLALGGELQLTATALYDDGTERATSPPTRRGRRATTRSSA
jgi:hypothetical protein